MKHRLSSYLSPSAKKAFLRRTGEERVKVQIEVDRRSDIEALQARLAEHGACNLRWHESTGLLAADLPAAKLSDVAEDDDVVYLEVAERLGL